MRPQEIVEKTRAIMMLEEIYQDEGSVKNIKYHRDTETGREYVDIFYTDKSTESVVLFEPGIRFMLKEVTEQIYSGYSLGMCRRYKKD